MAPDDQPPAEPTPEPALLALARKKFGTLARAEEELFRAAQEGRAASALTNLTDKDDPATAANWPADRTVRAECISWVCTDPHASALVSYRGLELYGMRIVGRLDLGNTEIKFPLRVWKCAFAENISLQDAQLREFYLENCQVKSLNAGGATVSGTVFLRGKGFKAEGEVNLVAATIGGSLDCSGAQFINAKGLALNADGAKIEGAIFLCNGFIAQGEVSLSGIIARNLVCDGAHFSNAQGYALNASGAKVEGRVFLRGSEAKGEVRLTGIQITGALECDGAQFLNAKGLALNANGAEIEGLFFSAAASAPKAKSTCLGQQSATSRFVKSVRPNR